jgi:UDP-N-acetylglucosamine 1-carboxyvinyltransferase
MDIKVKGGQVLNGEIYPSGSKNSAVAILPATIMFDKPLTLKNVPDITDVIKLVSIMEKLGSRVDWNRQKKEMKIDNSKLSFDKVEEEDWNKMRGTSLLWGPMLTRFGRLTFGGLPGGCTLGYRTLAPHYNAFRALGVKIEDSDKGIKMDAHLKHSNEFWLTEMSPTATENAVMLAIGIPGITKIVGAASEPQVQDLCQFLNSAGAKIQGVGSSILTIDGGSYLRAVEHKLFSDHYEIATFLAMAAVTGGEVKVHNAYPELFVKINEVFKSFAINIDYKGDTAVVLRNQRIKILRDDGRDLLTVKAQPWPGLPVDLLPLFIPLAMAAEKGQVLFHNWMYEAGLYWTSELVKLGANIVMCDPHRIIVLSGSKIKGDTLEAPYIIRAVTAMVMAAMIAKGETTILNADALYRGHPDFSENLQKLGADIVEIK